MATQQEKQSTTVARDDRILFEIAPVAIWKEDWTDVEKFCEEMRTAGTTDLRRELKADRDLLRKVVSLIRVVDLNHAAATFFGSSSPSDLVGSIPGELLNEDSLLALLEQIMIVWEGRADLHCDIVSVDLDGAAMDTELHWAAPVNDGIPDYSRVVIVIQDVGRHRSAEREMRKHVQQLETLIDLGRGLASSFDKEIILQLLVEISVELTGTERGLILLFDGSQEKPTRVVTHGYTEETAAESPYIDMVGGVGGWVVTNRRATISADLGKDVRNARLSADRIARLEGIAVAVAPIIADDLVLGTLTTLKGADEPPFTGRDLSLVRMLAAQAAVAIRNADVYEALHNAHEELKEAQTQLLQAQKLEAIGSLAAGIAHEINTPIQYISDNTSFVKEAIGSLTEVAAAQWQFLEMAARREDLKEDAAALQSLWREKDCDFLMEEIPFAADETLEGARRVAEIVRAMKEFAHPGTTEKCDVDVNRVIRTTVQISRNEWKYVADLEFDLDDTIPVIPGLTGPLGQSLLIMFVNSAQAMADHRDGNSDEKGTILVSTSHDDDAVEVRVADDGPGIPQSIVDRIFDPFFTTKDVGKGSGQGLSIARSVVVDKHQGEIWVEDGNPGAVFVIRLPIKDPKRHSQATSSTTAVMASPTPTS